jgi:hypothetical protein
MRKQKQWAVHRRQFSLDHIEIAALITSSDDVS